MRRGNLQRESFLKDSSVKRRMRRGYSRRLKKVLSPGDLAAARWSSEKNRATRLRVNYLQNTLPEFEPVDTVTGGYQARCMLCRCTTWVGQNGLRYSLLEETCPGTKEE
jgi:hypothetical protein